MTSLASMTRLGGYAGGLALWLVLAAAAQGSEPPAKESIKGTLSATIELAEGLQPVFIQLDHLEAGKYAGTLVYSEPRDCRLTLEYVGSEGEAQRFSVTGNDACPFSFEEGDGLLLQHDEEGRLVYRLMIDGVEVERGRIDR
jgi:hypothetical protein